MHRPRCFLQALVLLVAFLACPPLDAQGQASSPPESRVRILATPGDGGSPIPLVGVLTEIRADTLLLTVDGETSLRKIPLAQVREAALSRGGETYARNGGRAGAIVGGLALGGWSYLEESTSPTCRVDCVYHNPSLVPMTIFGLASGALGGWYLGRLVGSHFSTERWERIPLDRLSVQASQHGLVLRIAVHR